MENSTSNKSKFSVIIIVVLIVAINLFAWAIFWLTNRNNTPDTNSQLPVIPQVDNRTIPVIVEADHPAVSALNINYTYLGQIQSIKQTNNEGSVMYELVLQSNNEVVPQTFYISQENDIAWSQQSGGELTVNDLKQGNTVQIQTTFDVKNDSDRIVSITRSN